MRVFIGGVMQASISGKGILDQGYRARIAAAFLARWPGLDVIDPYILHPNSVEYDDAMAKETLFAMAELAAHADLVIAYLPVASMGTALEMYMAYEHSVPVIAISPLATNWVVKALAQQTYPDLESFLAAVQGAREPLDLARRQTAA